MLCERCQQEPASVFLTQIVNGRSTRWDLCERCAAQNGLGHSVSEEPCFFCGAPSTGCGPMFSGDQWQVRFTCSDCQSLAHRFTIEAVHATAPDFDTLPPEQQGQIILQTASAVQERIRSHVRDASK